MSPRAKPQSLPPLAERQKPGLSLTLPFPRSLDTCQSCGLIGDPNAGRAAVAIGGETAGVALEKWQESDPFDRFTADGGQPVIVILCPTCSKMIIEPSARMYRRLDTWHPIPGAMALCHGCRFQADLKCAHPWLKANGGQGLMVRFPKPVYAHLNYGGGRGEVKHFFKGPPKHCAGRLERVAE